MKPTQPRVTRVSAVPAWSLATDLERFWPSRRGHAFDEFCR